MTITIQELEEHIKNLYQEIKSFIETKASSISTSTIMAIVVQLIQSAYKKVNISDAQVSQAVLNVVNNLISDLPQSSEVQILKSIVDGILPSIIADLISAARGNLLSLPPPSNVISNTSSTTKCKSIFSKK